MTTSTTSRFAAFSAALTVTFAILCGVASMATTAPAPAWMAKAAVVKTAA